MPYAPLPTPTPGFSPHDHRVLVLSLLGVVAALLPPPFSHYALALWALVAYIIAPITLWRWQFYLLLGFLLVTAVAMVVPFSHTHTRWATHLSSVGIPIPATLSVQPMVTLAIWPILALGAICVIWYLGRSYHPRTPKVLLRYILLLLGVLSAIAVVCLVAGIPNPFIPQSPIFSYFANRNQSATLYAITALIGLGLFLLERRRHWRTLGLLVGLLAVGALAYSPSRGGWLSLVIGAFVIFLRARHGLRWGLLAVLFGALLVIWGLPGLASRTDTGPDIRPTFYLDTLRLITAHPLGVGLGNFTDIFPHYQSFSPPTTVPLHPEHDWLWLAAESGIFALLIPLAFFTLRWGGDRRRSIVLGVLAGVLAASFFDVPLHRLGIVILSTALLSPVLRWPSAFFSGGVLQRVQLVAIAAIIMLSWVLHSYSYIPAQLRQGFVQALATRDLQIVSRMHTRLTSFHPLSYLSYLQLGQAQLAWGGASVLSTRAAAMLFARASMLQPALPQLPLDIGFAWAPVDTDRALSAWRESLRRASPTDRSSIFAHILQRGGLSSRVYYATLCGADAGLWALLFSAATPSELPQLVTLARAYGIAPPSSSP